MYGVAAKPHCRVMHGDAASPPHGSQPSADSLTWHNLEKLYLFHMIPDKYYLYMKIVALDEIYTF